MMNPLKFARAQQRSDSGFIMVVAPVAVLVALMFAAFIIDLNFAWNNKEKATNLAKGIALAYMERTFSEPCDLGDAPTDPTCIVKKRNAAMARASEMAGKNVISTTGTQNDVTDFYSGSSADPVIITPGRWVICNPTPSINSPEYDVCQASSGGLDSFFMPIDDFNAIADPDVLMNAVDVSGNLFDYEPMIANSFGFNLIELNVEAFATTSPRIAMVLFDLSGTIFKATFPQYYDANPQDDVPDCGQGHKIAYPLSSDPDQAAEWAQITAWATAGFPPASAPIQNIGFTPTHWNWLATNHPARAAGTQTPNGLCDTTPGAAEIHHYADDYVPLFTLGDNHRSEHELWYASQYPNYDYPHASEVTYPANTAGGDWFLVNANETASVMPFEGVIEGVNYLIDQFEARNTEGDALGLMGFSGGTSWPQFVLPTDNFDYLRLLVNFDDFTPPGSVSGDNPLAVPATSDHASNFGLGGEGRKRFYRHFLSRNSFTNLQAPLVAANNAFSNIAATGLPSSFSVFIFSDMISNCIECVSSDPSCNPICSNSYSVWKDAVEEIFVLAFDQYANAEISIHPILVGDHVLPHTLELQKDAAPNECYSDAEFRKEHMAAILNGTARFVRGGNAAGVEDDTINGQLFVDIQSNPLETFAAAANPVYDAAVLTKGVFAPLRGTDASCPAFNPCTDPRPVDGTGGYKRLLYDPLCRSEREQVEAVVDQVLATNPFILVTPE